MAEVPRELALIRLLGAGFGPLTKITRGLWVEAGRVSLERQGHQGQVHLDVRGSYEETFVLRWPAATKAMRDSHNDEEKAAENGAYCIAALLIFDLVGYTLLLQSRKGTGFDYWLGSKQPPYFQARLEVSGINNGDESLINARVKEKLTQTNPSDDLKLPAYVVIVEFGTPQARVVKK